MSFALLMIINNRRHRHKQTRPDTQNTKVHAFVAYLRPLLHTPLSKDKGLKAASRLGK